MSVYQYYEWLAIDQPLTAEEVAEVKGLSSHMEVATATQAVVTYHWSDFRHDSRKVLLRYFDAMLYVANWGSRRLMFRFPGSAVDEEAIWVYCTWDQISLQQEGKFQLLEIDLSQEEGGDWIEGAGILGQLAPLREQIIQGDYRALYLVWLKAKLMNERNGVDDESEPPVPPGLRNLTASHKALMQFFDIDPHLVQAAAEASDSLVTIPVHILADALPRLSRKESDAFLLRVLQNEPQVSRDLRKRLIELVGLQKSSASPRSRTPSELAETARRYAEEEQRRQEGEAERKRILELEELAKREEPAWTWVERLIEQKQAKPYDEAVEQLVKLRDLAIYKHRLPAFKQRFAAVANRCTGRRSLMDRFRRAGLLG